MCNVSCVFHMCESVYEKKLFTENSQNSPSHPISDLREAKFLSIHSMLRTLMDFSLRFPSGPGLNFRSLIGTWCSGEPEEPHNIIVGGFFFLNRTKCSWFLFGDIALVTIISRSDWQMILMNWEGEKHLTNKSHKVSVKLQALIEVAY